MTGILNDAAFKYSFREFGETMHKIDRGCGINFHIVSVSEGAEL